MSPYSGDNPDLLNQAKDNLLKERYIKFHGTKYLEKEELYRGDSENGFSSGEIRKKTENDEYYSMRAEFNKQKYLEMLSNKVMDSVEGSRR